MERASQFPINEPEYDAFCFPTRDRRAEAPFVQFQGFNDVGLRPRTVAHVVSFKLFCAVGCCQDDVSQPFDAEGLTARRRKNGAQKRFVRIGHGNPLRVWTRSNLYGVARSLSQTHAKAGHPESHMGEVQPIRGPAARRRDGDTLLIAATKMQVRISSSETSTAE